jgi:hypothetical protein
VKPVTKASIRIEQLCEDPCGLAALSAAQLFALDEPDVDHMQLEGLKRRFDALVSKLPALQLLAQENAITEITAIHDVVPLLFPHTEYKSYPLSLIDNGRFAHLNEWLNDFTVFDLSDLDLTGCETLDDWLEVVEAHTPVRVITSSGTSGKITLMPRSTVEEPCVAAQHRLAYEKFGDEPGLVDTYGPDVYHVQTTARRGRMAMNRSVDIRVKYGFGGDESHVLALDGDISTDVLWMTGRMRKAQADGTLEQLKQTKAWKRLSDRFGEMETARAKPDDAFFVRLLTTLQGKSVAMAAGLTFYSDMLDCARRHKLEIDFAPASRLMTAGGIKGIGSLTEAQIADVEAAYPVPMGDLYGFSEAMALAPRCAHGHYHMPPSIVSFVLDPDTGVPFPREGIQKGRYAAFDLWAQTYWGGVITGDEVTMHWEGSCACGRKGPYMAGDIGRYSDRRDGDDKITCQRTAAAVEEMIQSMKQTIG